MAWVAVVVVNAAAIYLVIIFIRVMTMPLHRPLTEDEQLWIKELADAHPEDR